MSRWEECGVFFFNAEVIISVVDGLNIKLESYVSFAANNEYNTTYMLNSDEVGADERDVVN